MLKNFSLRVFLLLILNIYNFFTSIFTIIMETIWLFHRDDKLGSRLLKNIPTNNKLVLWIHAASIGEIKSIEALLRILANEYPSYTIIISSLTQTSRNILLNNFSSYGNIEHIFLPYDSSFLVNKFLKIYNPKLAIFIEQDFFPIYLHKLKQKNIPTILLNGRISNKSISIWKKFPTIIAYLLDCFTEIYVQSIVFQEAIQSLTKKPVKFIGNLKLTNITPHITHKSELPLIFQHISDKIIFFCISTHEDEEDALVQIHLNLIKKHPQLLTLIMPRHINRIDNLIYELHNKFHIEIPKLSSIGSNNYPVDSIIFLDTIGRTNDFCQISSIAFVGKTLSNKKKGGQNLLEPLINNVVTCFGPNIDNFQDIAHMALNHNAALAVKNQDELERKLDSLLSNPILLKQMQNNCQYIFNNNQILNKTLGIIKCYL